MSVSQMRILGIDVAKAKLDVSLLLPDGKFRSEVIANTPEGFEKLAGWNGMAPRRFMPAWRRLEFIGNP